MIDICSKQPLPSICPERYVGMAFDGCRYYLTMECQPKIVILNHQFCFLNCMDTRRRYTEICYDSEENCFWAASDTSVHTLFKLDCSLQEIDRIIVRPCKCCPIVITGVSFCCKNNYLVVCSGNKIIAVNKCNGDCEVIHEESQKVSFTGVICAFPLLICCANTRRENVILFIDCTGNRIAEMKLPENFLIHSAFLFPQKDPCGGWHLYMLASKHYCYSYLLDMQIDQILSDQIYNCYTEWCDRCHSECRDECRSECCDKCCDKNDCHPSKKSSCNKILESIALEEASIAHILNAEGEKLQKAIAESCSICELLAINESVQKTIIHATHLEQVLYAKLEMIQKHCKDECECVHLL